MRIYQIITDRKSEKNIYEVKKFLIWFYIIGLSGFIIPFTKPHFIHLTPFALLLNAFLIVIFHQSDRNRNTILFVISVFISSFAIEAAGVHSGIIFGNYRYGKGLGLKLFDTPLIIGMNWAMLIYCSALITDKIIKPLYLRVIAAPALMVLYDLALEFVAPKLDMWYWLNNQIPFQNFIAWYVIALIFHLILRILRIKIKNPIAITVFFIQFGFFLLLLIILAFF